MIEETRHLNMPTEQGVAFAKQTMKTYRRCVLMNRKKRPGHFHFASLPQYREGFIQSYLTFKRFVFQHSST